MSDRFEVRNLPDIAFGNRYLQISEFINLVGENLQHARNDLPLRFMVSRCGRAHYLDEEVCVCVPRWEADKWLCNPLFLRELCLRPQHWCEVAPSAAQWSCW